jgi:hypothetical protein
MIRNVALSLLVSMVGVTTAFGAPATEVAPKVVEQHRHDRGLLQSGMDPFALFRGEDGFPDRKNRDGQYLSGGRAVAHRAGGKEVTTPSVVAQAPDGRFFRLGINGWEPSIGVDDKGRIFYQARNADLAPQVMRSTNEGHTWEKVSPTIGGAPAQPISLDPLLYLDKDTGRVFTNNIPPDITCQPISFTDDAGESWTTTSICGHFDHQNIFTGPPTKDGDQPSGYPNVVYYCAINLVMLSGTSTATTCGKSLDGGLTWLPTGEPAYITPVPPPDYQEEPWCDGAVGHGYVGPDGTVYLPRVFCGQAFLSISHDEGFTWDQVQVAKNGGLGHEAGVAADGKGNLYFTWIAGDGLPYLSVSRDGGEKWGKPLMIGAPGLKQARLPALDMGDPGKIAITYIGSETPGKDSEKWKWNGYITITEDATAADPLFYTGTMNSKRNPLHIGECGSVRCHSLGDFFDVTIGPDGTPWVSYVNACYEPDYCVPTFEAVGLRGESVVGRLVGGPKLR